MDKDCFYTDDTVMTVAVADAILNHKDFGKTMKAYGRKYPNSGYGGKFNTWLKTNNNTPYFSCGNGSAMRISAAAYAYNNWGAIMDIATKATIVTHNHPEGIRGAQATATAIYMARHHYTKRDIKEYIEHEFAYDLDFTIADIRPTYKFTELCQNTVPQALVAFFESKNFEDAIKIAISLGGDADTLAAITGSIAEAYYGVPEKMIEKAKKFLPKEFIEILDKI